MKNKCCINVLFHNLGLERWRRTLKKREKMYFQHCPWKNLLGEKIPFLFCKIFGYCLPYAINSTGKKLFFSQTCLIPPYKSLVGELRRSVYITTHFIYMSFTRKNKKALWLTSWTTNYRKRGWNATVCVYIYIYIYTRGVAESSQNKMWLIQIDVEYFTCTRKDTENFWVITEKICHKIMKNLQHFNYIYND